MKDGKDGTIARIERKAEGLEQEATEVTEKTQSRDLHHKDTEVTKKLILNTCRSINQSSSSPHEERMGRGSRRGAF
jgi:hypothetical protein